MHIFGTLEDTRVTRGAGWGNQKNLSTGRSQPQVGRIPNASSNESLPPPILCFEVLSSVASQSKSSTSSYLKNKSCLAQKTSKKCPNYAIDLPIHFLLPLKRVFCHASHKSDFFIFLYFCAFQSFRFFGKSSPTTPQEVRTGFFCCCFFFCHCYLT